MFRLPLQDRDGRPFGRTKILRGFRHLARLVRQFKPTRVIDLPLNCVGAEMIRIGPVRYTQQYEIVRDCMRSYIDVMVERE